MTDECIVGREMYLRMREAGHAIEAVIVERSARADREKAYLVNNAYNPPAMDALLVQYPTEVIGVDNLNGDAALAALQRLKSDVNLLDGSTIIKPRIFQAARLGSINSHPGLLPEFRGVDSVRWAIHHRQSVGATCHFVDQGLDTGPILVRREVPYALGETILEIRVRTMRACVEIVVEAIAGLQYGTLIPKPQVKHEGAYFSWAPVEVQLAVDRYLATGQ